MQAQAPKTHAQAPHTQAPKPEDELPGKIKPYNRERATARMANPPPPTPTQAEADAAKQRVTSETSERDGEQRRDMKPAAGGTYQTR
jgi:hypothetical protein